MKDAAEILRQNDLFRNVPEEVLGRLAAKAQRRHFQAGQRVFIEGAPGNALFIVIEGEVRITIVSPTRKDLTLALVYPGEAFGELSLFDDEDKRSATATATMDTQLLVIFNDDFQQAIENDPAAFRSFLKVMADTIRRMNERLKTVAMLGTPGRVAQVLLEMATRHGKPHPAGTMIDHELSYDDLEGLCLLYRSEVLHAMERWELDKLVYLEDGRWIITPKGRDALEYASNPS